MCMKITIISNNYGDTWQLTEDCSRKKQKSHGRRFKPLPEKKKHVVTAKATDGWWETCQYFWKCRPNCIGFARLPLRTRTYSQQQTVKEADPFKNILCPAGSPWRGVVSLWFCTTALQIWRHWFHFLFAQAHFFTVRVLRHIVYMQVNHLKLSTGLFSLTLNLLTHNSSFMGISLYVCAQIVKTNTG